MNYRNLLNLTPTLSWFEILNDATVIIQNWMVWRFSANIFHYWNLAEEHKKNSRKFVILIFQEILFWLWTQLSFEELVTGGFLVLKFHSFIILCYILCSYSAEKFLFGKFLSGRKVLIWPKSSYWACSNRAQKFLLGVFLLGAPPNLFDLKILANQRVSGSYWACSNWAHPL